MRRSFDQMARAAFAKAGIMFGDVSWTNLHRQSSPVMSEHVEYDENLLHGQDSVNWAAAEPSIFEWVDWQPNVEIVVER